MELEFKPAASIGVGGIQAKHEFPNHWGVSVVRGPYSFGGDEGLYELAVTRNGSLHYENPVGKGDVVSHLTLAEAGLLADKIAAWPDAPQEWGPAERESL